MSRSWISLLVFLLVIIVSIPLVRLFLYPPQAHDMQMVHLQSLDAGQGRSVEILGRLMHNQAQAFYYVPVQEGRALSEPHFFASLPAGYPELLFTAHVPGESSLVAVAAEPDPHAVLAVYDFEHTSGWPSHRDESDPERYQQRGRDLLEKLQANDSTETYEFVRAESTRPLQVLIDLGFEPPDWPEDAAISPLYQQRDE